MPEAVQYLIMTAIVLCAVPEVIVHHPSCIPNNDNGCKIPDFHTWAEEEGYLWVPSQVRRGEGNPGEGGPQGLAVRVVFQAVVRVCKRASEEAALVALLKATGGQPAI